jgi:outer membrane protein OmpA-like peptidoglycan-associated protein
LRIATVLGALLIAAPAIALERPETIDRLASIPAIADRDRFRAWLNGVETGPTDVVRNSAVLGDELLVHLRSSEEAHWIAVHVDANGMATLLHEPGSRLGAGAETTYPSDGRLVAALPTGPFEIFAFAVREPIPETVLASGMDGDVVSVETTRRSLDALAAELGRRPRESVAVARIRGRILGRSELRGIEAIDAGKSTRGMPPDVTAEEIVDYFCCRGRLVGSRTDTLVHFDTNDATLSELARANLDQWGAALRDEALRKVTFVVAGHADARGSAEHNMQLSTRRARAVHEYLVTKHGIEPGRLQVEAMGESVPMVAEESAWAYMKNRRVEMRVAAAP